MYGKGIVSIHTIYRYGKTTYQGCQLELIRGPEKSSRMSYFVRKKSLK